MKEAISRADLAIQRAKNEGQPELKFIVGQLIIHDSLNENLNQVNIYRERPAFSRRSGENQACHRRFNEEVHTLRLLQNNSLTFFSSRHQLSAQLDPNNAGVLVVLIDSHQRGIGPEEITRRLNNQQESCTIM